MRRSFEHYFLFLAIYSNTQNDFSLRLNLRRLDRPLPDRVYTEKASLGVTITSNVSDNDFGAQFVIKSLEIRATGELY